MLVWTVANQKGGVGKTTTAIALAGLCAEQGKRVLLVDLDPHGSLSSYLKFDPSGTGKGSFTLFQQRRQLSRELVRSCIQPAGFERLEILVASLALATLEREAISRDGMGLVLSRALQLVAPDYDLAIVDCPPTLGVLMINALAACQQLVIPVQTEFLALKGLERMTQTLAMMGKSRRQALAYSIVPTMFDRRTQASVSSLRVIRNSYSEGVWPGKIPVDTRLRDASKAGVPPGLYQPDGRGVEAYRSLLKWLLAHNTAPEVAPVARALP